MSVEFRILGPLEIARDGEAVEAPGKKQRAALAMLLLNANEVVSTDRLIHALWGEDPPESAHKALQVHISQLRKTLDPRRDPDGPASLVLTRPPGYMLSVEPERLDLARFDQLARRGHDALAAGEPERAAEALREALSLWRGEALADLAYEPFVQAEVARLADVRLAALEDRIEAELECGRHTAVIAELEALVAAEPLRERPWGQLMLALYRCGRQADALDAFRRAREILVEELGIEPGKDLRQLHDAILAQDPELDLVTAATAVAEPAPPAAPVGASPEVSGFVGRKNELAELGKALEQALDGRGGACLIGGEPGIGKTRLADEVSRLARARGAQVLWGRCWEAGGAPAYWPWVQALRAHLAEVDDDSLRSELGPRGSEVAQLLPELRERFPDLPVPGPTDSEGARFRLFDATAELIKRIARRAPIAVVLDDLHAADTPSLLMLRFVAGEIADAPVLLLGTYRDVEVGPDHPLDATLNDLARQQGSRVIRLEGMPESDVSQLIEARTEKMPSRKAVAAIHRGTAGNPLFVDELVQLLVAEGRLEDAAGDSAARVGIPRGVHDVIGRRLERVGPECRRVLGVAAVLGREFDLETLGEVTQRPAEELLEVLDESIGQRIVTEVTGMPQRLRFSHVLIRDVLYEELGTVRRRRLHERAGRALETLHAADLGPHFAELAHHFYEAGPTGDSRTALAHARRAGAHAASQLAFEEAARLYELALRIQRTAALTDEPTRCELLLGLAEARLRAGDEDDAKTTFLEAAEIARRLADAGALARAALGYGGLMVWAAARADPDLIPLLEEALAALPDEDSSLRARLLARLSCAVRNQPDRDRRLPLSAEAVEMARRLGDRRTLAYALDARSISMVDPGSMESFTETSREVVSVAEEIGELERALVGNLYLFASLMQRGDVAGARRAAEAMSRQGEDLREPTYRWASAEADAALALFEGRFDVAGELIDRAYEIGRHAVRFNAGASYQLQRFLLHRELGGLERCEDGLRTAAAATPEYHILRSALADLHLELGRAGPARAIYEDLAQSDFEHVYYDEEFLASMTLLADVCVALGDAEGAARIYEKLSPHAGRAAFAMVEFALGAIDRPLGILARATGRKSDAVDHLEAAIEMNLRMGGRPWVAHSEFELGRTLAAATGPERERAVSLLEHALSEYRDMGMTPWAQRVATELERVSEASS